MEGGGGGESLSAVALERRGSATRSWGGGGGTGGGTAAWKAAKPGAKGLMEAEASDPAPPDRTGGSLCDARLLLSIKVARGPGRDIPDAGIPN
mmetsp:Transcript_71848/g.150094  ORF Transcript_71848/g.150094 Transcript_71848/m.150094 type:complete len:93 (-) Transcript_71848:516-794(-)